MKLEICNDTRLCDRWSKRHFVVVTVSGAVVLAAAAATATAADV